jgi:hypothetical protein
MESHTCDNKKKHEKDMQHFQQGHSMTLAAASVISIYISIVRSVLEYAVWHSLHLCHPTSLKSLNACRKDFFKMCTTTVPPRSLKGAMSIFEQFSPSQILPKTEKELHKI